jgi:type IV pilus assembly protein PilC
MADFAWEARSRTGELRKGVMEADSQAAVENKLRQQQFAR